MTRTLPLLVALALLSGCSYGALNEDVATGADVDPVLGQTILFVGTDPATLTTDVYQVQAVTMRDGARSEQVLDADAFEVTSLSDFSVGPESPVQTDDDVLLPSAQPFPIPDRLGERVAVVATGYDAEGGVLGRVAVLDLLTGEQVVLPPQPLLRAVRFSWYGGWLLAEHVDAEGRSSLSVTNAWLDLADAVFSPVTVEGATSLAFGGLLPESDSFIVMATTYDGTVVYELDPMADQMTLLVDPIDGALARPSVSPDGLLLATTRSDPNTGRRTVLVTARGEGEGSTWIPLNDPALDDCRDPAWAPATADKTSYKLAYVCEELATGRPDVYLWQSDTAPPPEGQSAVEQLTAGAQTSVPDSSMDGLVLRSRLRWDRSGQVLVFGASNQDDALEDAPMTLLALDLVERRAVPVYDGDDGVADLAHFSAIADEPVLLVWDRSASGLQDSQGQHPIQLVSADPAGGRQVRGVTVGRDLYVSYPLFLGGNTLLYP